MLRRLLIIAATLAVLPTAAASQVPLSDSTVVDRVLAVVGDSVVLLSQVQEEIQRLSIQGQEIPSDPLQQEAFVRNILDTWINRLLIIRAAAQDTLVQVDEDRIEEIVRGEIENRATQLGGQRQLQEALAQEGMTLAQFRDMLRDQVRQQQIQETYVQLRLRDAPPVEVSEDEMLEYFQAARQGLQQRPRTLTFHQAVVAPAPSDSTVSAARAKADSLLGLIRAGESFEELAREHSDDPGSAANGGDLDWFRRGTMVREFEDVAFNLTDGQVSDVVETEFGYHIIKVERSRAGERKGRHILISPEVTPAQVEEAKATAREVARQARAGGDMDSLYAEYSDPEAPDSLTVTQDQLNQLPPGYDLLSAVPEGDVVGPLEYQNGRGETRIAIIKMTQVREAGAYTFEDVKGQVAQQLQRQKQVARIIEDIREKTHIEIRM